VGPDDAIDQAREHALSDISPSTLYEAGTAALLTQRQQIGA
jgi:hypothetical protein